MTGVHRSASRGLTLLSIRPQHVSAILTGTKTVELRRTRPQVNVGQPIAIYATAPLSAVVATCTVALVEVMEPESLKLTAFRAAAVSEAEYDTYFHGAARAVAIHLENVVLLSNPLTLSDLRGRHKSFQPPQSWHFLDEIKLMRLVGDHTAHATLVKLLDGHPTQRSRS